MSRRQDPEAEATYAFSQYWSLSRGYALILLGRCLTQVREQNVQPLCIVTTVWDHNHGTEHRLPSPVSNGLWASQQGEVSTPTSSSSTSRLACLNQRYSTLVANATHYIPSKTHNQLSDCNI